MKVKGYKATCLDMTCRGVQFELGQTYTIESPTVKCENGFHFCQEIENVLDFYELDKCRIFEVVGSGVIVSDKVKSVSSEITFVREVNYHDLLKGHVKNSTLLEKTNMIDRLNMLKNLKFTELYKLLINDELSFREISFLVKEEKLLQSALNWQIDKFNKSNSRCYELLICAILRKYGKENVIHLLINEDSIYPIAFVDHIKKNYTLCLSEILDINEYKKYVDPNVNDKYLDPRIIRNFLLKSTNPIADFSNYLPNRYANCEFAFQTIKTMPNSQTAKFMIDVLIDQKSETVDLYLSKIITDLRLLRGFRPTINMTKQLLKKLF